MSACPRWVGLGALGWSCQAVSVGPTRITVEVRTTATSACCPRCGQASRRIHSRYHRRLADLPTSGRPVQLRVTVRRFFCDDPPCPQEIFTERLPGMAGWYARRTERLRQAHGWIGLEMGGQAGARLAGRLGMPASGATLLRIVRQAQLPETAAPRVLGVDDWALCRGQRYGTILCDLEHHRRLDLLPERSAPSLAHWLREHPGVEVISRDRGEEYRKGATAGAPQAQQVADRWHLLHNLSDALVHTVERHHTQIRQAAKATVLPDEPVTTH